MKQFDPIEKLAATVSDSGGSSRAIVFVNGFGETQVVWHDIASAFANAFRIVTYDHAGTGGAPSEAFSQHRYLNLRAYARDLTDLARALELRDAVVVGHSVGGMIAALASIERPQSFGRIVLIGASPRYLDEPGYPGGYTESDLQQLYRSVTLDYSKWAEAFAPTMMGNLDRPQLAAHFTDTLKHIPPEHALSALCAIFQSDHRADLGKLRQPALILQTKVDPAVPFAVAEYLHAHIADSRLVVLDAEGHCPHVSAPDQVVRAIAEFVNG